MKHNNIEKRIGSFLLATFLFLLLGTSCIDDFAEINKNPLYPDKEVEKQDGILYGAYLANFQKAVIPIGTAADKTEPVNRYQISVNLAGDAWAGYMSARENKWNGALNFTNYFMYENWVNYTFGFMVTDVFTPWIQIKRNSQDEGAKNDEIYALAQVIKIAALHRTTDMFGPIPYFKVGSGSFKVPYDSQEDVYRSFFKELEEAIDMLTKYSEKSDKVLADFDAVYEGEVNKWIRFANSLMLRLAIRVRYADEALAKEYAEKAVIHPKGLITTPEDAPKMGKGAGLQMKNPLKTIRDEYNDTRMGATIYCYLQGYSDPRGAVYFNKVSGAFKAVRTGIPQTNVYGDFSTPKTSEDDPLYWMKASEVLFLKAEGALAGFEMGGKAKDFYNDGVRMSFQENGVSDADTYLANSSYKPVNYTDSQNSSLSVEAPSAITIRWNESTDAIEENLERIITQKYLAIYPNGQEAWTEWRRTGYPRQIVVAENKTNANVSTGNGFNRGGVRRLPYPRNEYDQNGANVSDAVSKYLNGTDDAATNVWWDKKYK